ncbi:glutamate-5-semialdehyde dehydrogenase [Dehalococcoidia bacterium]|nr:glutamate-5-semialdehyde dehydrogenase [Dehalococcoidia bacterium]
MKINQLLKKQGVSASAASRKLRTLDKSLKDSALRAMADSLNENSDTILRANSVDIKNAKALGVDFHVIERMILDNDRVTAMVESLYKISDLDDPIGEIIESSKLLNGLLLEKVRVPLGVIGVIYESRPNITVDISALCIKSGNSVILRGGKEAFTTNSTITNIIRKSAETNGLPLDTVQFVSSTDRSLVKQMLNMDQYIDLMIPRGSSDLVNFVAENAKMPAITGGVGVCHTFVDKSADFKKAIDIVVNAKVQRHTVCNALDTILIHQEIAKSFVPKLIEKMILNKVELRVDEKTLNYVNTKSKYVVPAKSDDYGKEFLALIASVKIVSSIDEAIKHIEKHGSGHSEAIITENITDSEMFLNIVDAAAVFANTSTRYNDGGEFGFGAEVAISTNKLHARGPMGLKELTSYKWKVRGNGQIRE